MSMNGVIDEEPTIPNWKFLAIRVRGGWWTAPAQGGRSEGRWRRTRRRLAWWLAALSERVAP